jgi:hypothetical protein
MHTENKPPYYTLHDTPGHPPRTPRAMPRAFLAACLSISNLGTTEKSAIMFAIKTALFKIQSLMMQRKHIV